MKFKDYTTTYQHSYADITENNTSVIDTKDTWMVPINK